MALVRDRLSLTLVSDAVKEERFVEGGEASARVWEQLLDEILGGFCDYLDEVDEWERAKRTEGLAFYLHSIRLPDLLTRLWCVCVFWEGSKGSFGITVPSVEVFA